MPTKIELRVNGLPYTLWKNLSYTRSIDTNAGDFTFSTTNTLPQAYPVKAGDAVQVLVNGVSKVFGYVDEISASGDNGGSSVQVRGRDNICDLIDSSVPDSVKDIDGDVSLASLCQRVISALGASIPVVDKSGGASAKNPAEDKTGRAGSNSGRKCMELLNSFARKAQVYLIPSGDGKLVIYRPGSDRAHDPIQNMRNGRNNNVTNWSISQSWQDRFHTYKVTSQDNFSDDSDDYGEGTDRSGTLTDPEIRTSRYLEVQAKESSDDGQCGGQANEEANLRRARSTEYCVTIPDVMQRNGSLWDIGQLVRVSDEFAGVAGTLLIRSVNVSQDNSGGTSCKLTLCPPDAYNVQGVASTKTRMRAMIGTEFTSG
jgi:prophage tail gpP-like protein